VLQPGRNLDFVQKFLVPGMAIFFRDLERYTLLLNSVVGAINIGQWTGCDASDDRVLADFLPGSEQGLDTPLLLVVVGDTAVQSLGDIATQSS
jgi:hypothetical protein